MGGVGSTYSHEKVRLNYYRNSFSIFFHCRSGEETSDRIEIIRYLLKHEARVICFDENKLTPLMLAAQKGFSKICEIFLTHSNFSYEKTAKHSNLRARW